MGSSTSKKLQLVVILGVGAFLALGFTAVREGFREIRKWGGPTLNAKGPQATEARTLSDFNRVQAGEIFEVDVKIGPVPSVVIEAPRDLIRHLTSKIENGTLVLSSDINYSTTGRERIRAHVVVRHLTGASISGSGKMSINSKITANLFDAHASGASTFKMSGCVNTLDIELSGSAKADVDAENTGTLRLEASGASRCVINGKSETSSIELSGASNFEGNFTSGSTKVQASGASRASLRVLKSFTGEASGASQITYSGSPSNVIRHTSGVSSIEKR